MANISKILFLNTAWMEFYQGLNNDIMHGGGKNVETYGWGGEMFNFQKFRSKYYGSVQPVERKKTQYFALKIIMKSLVIL